MVILLVCMIIRVLKSSSTPPMFLSSP